MSPGAAETLLSGEAAANILLPVSAAEERADKDGIAAAKPKYRIPKRKVTFSDSVHTAPKAKAEQPKQRAASVQQPAFEAATGSPEAIGEPKQQEPAENDLLAVHAFSMQMHGVEEQPAAIQDAIQLEASAEKQQQDSAAPKIYQPAQQAVAQDEDAMAGQWWLSQDGFLQQEEIKFASVPERMDFGATVPEAASGEVATHETTAAIDVANFSPEMAVAAAESAERMQQQQEFGGADDGNSARAEELAEEIMGMLTPEMRQDLRVWNKTEPPTVPVKAREARALKTLKKSQLNALCVASVCAP